MGEVGNVGVETVVLLLIKKSPKPQSDGSFGVDYNGNGLKLVIY